MAKSTEKEPKLEKQAEKLVEKKQAAAAEGATKAEKFKKFLDENDINFFEANDLSDELHTTIFRSRIEAKGNTMPMAIFIDESIRSLSIIFAMMGMVILISVSPLSMRPLTAA